MFSDPRFPEAAKWAAQWAFYLLEHRGQAHVETPEMDVTYSNPNGSFFWRE